MASGGMEKSKRHVEAVCREEDEKAVNTRMEGKVE